MRLDSSRKALLGAIPVTVVAYRRAARPGRCYLTSSPAIPLVHVRDFARHSDLAVTQGYVHRIESGRVKTAMAEALG